MKGRATKSQPHKVKDPASSFQRSLLQHCRDSLTELLSPCPREVDSEFLNDPKLLRNPYCLPLSSASSPLDQVWRAVSSWEKSLVHFSFTAALKVRRKGHFKYRLYSLYLCIQSLCLNSLFAQENKKLFLVSSLKAVNYSLITQNQMSHLTIHLDLED